MIQIEKKRERVFLHPHQGEALGSSCARGAAVPLGHFATFATIRVHYLKRICEYTIWNEFNSCRTSHTHTYMVCHGQKK